MAGMSMKEISALVEHIEPQGVNVTRTKKGLLLRMPDRSTAMVHFTSSDVRMRKAVRAQLHRAGITFPGDDERTLSKAITDTRPLKSSLDAAQLALEGWDQKHINASQLIRQLKAIDPESSMTNVTAQRALYHLGWTPYGAPTVRKWRRPVEQDPEPIEPPVQLHPVQAPAEPEVPAEAPTEAPAAQARDFIDSVDSWTADLSTLPQQLTLAELPALLASLGVDGELRLWRKSN